MKIALCFSGLLRTFDRCIPSIVDHVIKANPEHEFHSFVASWLERGKSVAWHQTTQDMEIIEIKTFVNHMANLGLKSLRFDTYQGSDFMSKCAKELDVGGKYEKRQGEPSNPINFLPMIKKIEQAHVLMLENASNGVHYDVVVKLRADLMFTSKLEFMTPEPMKAYMPTHECWGPGSLNDQLIYGDGDTMSLHSGLYRNLDLMYAQTPTLHPETVLHNYYQTAGIKVVRHPINYKIER